MIAMNDTSKYYYYLGFIPSSIFLEQHTNTIPYVYFMLRPLMQLSALYLYYFLEI